MRATIYSGPYDLTVGDRPDPVIQQPADAVVRVVLGCVCGSDLWYYRGDSPTPPALSATSSSASWKTPAPTVRCHRRQVPWGRADHRSQPQPRPAGARGRVRHHRHRARARRRGHREDHGHDQPDRRRRRPGTRRHRPVDDHRVQHRPRRLRRRRGRRPARCPRAHRNSDLPQHRPARRRLPGTPVHPGTAARRPQWHDQPRPCVRLHDDPRQRRRRLQPHERAARRSSHSSRSAQHRERVPASTHGITGRPARTT